MKRLLFLPLLALIYGCTTNSVEKLGGDQLDVLIESKTDTEGACYILGEKYNGYSARTKTDFSYFEEEIELDRQFVLVNGDKSRNYSSEYDVCTQVGPDSVMCREGSGKPSMAYYQWTFFPESRKVIMNTTVVGLGEWDGGRILVGDIIGHCD